MAQKRTSDQNKGIHAAALSIANKEGWSAVTFTKISRKTRVTEKKLRALYRDEWQLLKEILDDVDAKTLAAIKNSLSDNWRDNLFDILMTRFDIAQKNRPAFKSLPDAFIKNPRAAPRFAKSFVRMIDRWLKIAGCGDTSCRPIRVLAFMPLYLMIVNVWIKDESKDMSATMAEVDRRLGNFETFIKEA